MPGSFEKPKSEKRPSGEELKKLKQEYDDIWSRWGDMDSKERATAATRLKELSDLMLGLDSSDQQTNPESEDKNKSEDKKDMINLDKLKIVLADVSSLVDQEAVMRAAKETQVETKEENSNMIKRWWKNNVTREYRKFWTERKEKREMRESGKVYADDTATKEALVERLTSEYDEMHANMDRKVLDQADEASRRLTGEIRDLIRAYATSQMTDEEFATARKRIFARKEKGKNVIDPNAVFMDNMLDVARGLRTMDNHQGGIEAVLEKIEVITGSAERSLKSQERHGAIEKAVDGLKKVGLGALVNETVLAGAVSAAYTFAMPITAGAGKIARAWGGFGLGAVLAGGAAYAKESYRTEQEFAQVSRELESGGVFSKESKEGEKNTPERAKYEQFIEKAPRIADAVAEMQSLAYVEGDPNKGLEQIDQPAFDTLMSTITNLEARMRIGHEQKILTLRYESEGSGQQAERMALIQEIARLKIKLQEQLTGGAKWNVSGYQDVRAMFDARVQQQRDDLAGGPSGVTERMKSFRKMKASQARKKAGRAMLIGGTIGAVVQVGTSMMSGTQEAVEGAVERGVKGAWSGVEAVTGANWLTRMWNGNFGIGMPHTAPNIENFPGLTNAFGDQIQFDLPDGVSLLDNNDGTFDLLDRAGKVLADNIPADFTPEGALEPNALQVLHDQGLNWFGQPDVISGVTSTDESIGDYVDRKVGKGADLVERDFWYGNDTPSPDFDLNELRVDWAGDAGSGYDTATGEYVLTMDRMMADGSFQTIFGTKFGVDPHDVLAGNAPGQSLVYQITAAEGYSDKVFSIPVGPNGEIRIDENSEVGKLFFEQVNGQTVFKGRFGELNLSLGDTDGDGFENIRPIATMEGEGLESVMVPGEDCHERITNIIDVPGDGMPPVFPPPILPLIGRRAIEQQKQRYAPGERPSLPPEAEDMPPIKDRPPVSDVPTRIDEIIPAPIKDKKPVDFEDAIIIDDEPTKLLPVAPENRTPAYDFDKGYRGPGGDEDDFDGVYGGGGNLFNYPIEEAASNITLPGAPEFNKPSDTTPDVVDYDEGYGALSGRSLFDYPIQPDTETEIDSNIENQSESPEAMRERGIAWYVENLPKMNSKTRWIMNMTPGQSTAKIKEFLDVLMSQNASDLSVMEINIPSQSARDMVALNALVGPRSPYAARGIKVNVLTPFSLFGGDELSPEDWRTTVLDVARRRRNLAGIPAGRAINAIMETPNQLQNSIDGLRRDPDALSKNIT